MTAAVRHFFKRQGAHFLLLAVLLVIAFRRPGPGALEGSLLGVSTKSWYVLGVAVPVVHQVYVWLAWRMELGWRAITGSFGIAGGFAAYRAVFMVLLIARPATHVALAVADYGSLYVPGPAAWIVSGLLALAAAWAGASTALFFGISRAVGADHFDPEYRTRPFERRGAFRYVPNSMYTLVFLGFWAVAVASGSQAAFLLAFFNHAYIWVHYWCTEQPDMARIYGNRLDELRRGAPRL